MVFLFWNLYHAVESVKWKILKGKSKNKTNNSDDLDFSSSSKSLLFRHRVMHQCLVSSHQTTKRMESLCFENTTPPSLLA